MSRKSVVVSAAGIIGGFFDKLVTKVRALGGDSEQFYELLVGKRSEEFIGQVADLAMKMVKSVRDGFHIVVDYARSLSEMISAGAYDWVNSDITSEHFPVKGEGRVELVPELVHYGKSMSSDDIIRDMDKRGLRPATLPELLAYGEKNPEKQREFPIVALDSVGRGRRGYRCVACLCCGGSARGLGLSVWSGGWDGHFRFLAFRK